MPEDLLLPPDDLIALAAAILVAAGTSPEHAEVVARSLVEANVAGHDSHGVLRLRVVRRVRPSAATVQPSRRARSSSSSAARSRASTAGGAGASSRRSSRPRPRVRLARSHGVGVVVVDRAGTSAGVGEYVETIAAAGFVGHALCNAEPAVAPPGTGVRALGTNPVAWAVPRADGEPVLVDFATAELAEGKLRVAVSRGEQLDGGRGGRRPGPALARPGRLLRRRRARAVRRPQGLRAQRGRRAAGPRPRRRRRRRRARHALQPLHPRARPAATGTAEGFLAAVDAWCGDVRERAEASGRAGDAAGRARGARARRAAARTACPCRRRSGTPCSSCATGSTPRRPPAEAS